LVIKGDKIAWRPGRAVVHGTFKSRDAIVAALADFALYEGELRRLEHELEGPEAAAEEDVGRAHSVCYRDRAHWPRFATMIESLAKMRLQLARLEPRLLRPSRNLSQSARRIVLALRRAAHVETRLEALNGRLEACEDLYEGANDRVADFRGWFNGHVLELIIVALIVEATLMGMELYARMNE